MNTTEDRVLQLIDACPHNELSLRRAALILGRSYPTLMRYRTKGYIRTIKKGGMHIVLKSEMRRFYLEGNYNPNFSDPDTRIPLSAEEELNQPLPIIRSSEGVDLCRLTDSQRESLGTPLPKPEYNEDEESTDN